jgi:predicted dithiol-disulfide oxidoreductase (DUF899 family)
VKETTMSKHTTGSHAEWLRARLELLKREKELTRLGDEVARQRQELPWVPLEKEYVFQTDDGPKTLAELFDGRSQLLVYHFMFGPDWDAGCPGCSFVADHLDGPRLHLDHHDVTLLCVSRAPLEKLQAYKRRMGWAFPWASSHGSDFNFDFGVSFTEEQRERADEYNFGTVAGDERYKSEELPGLSAFVLEDRVVYHTYSTYARGLDALLGTNHLLDRAPLGRNEDVDWVRRHDEYEVAAGAATP